MKHSQLLVIAVVCAGSLGIAGAVLQSAEPPSAQTRAAVPGSQAEPPFDRQAVLARYCVTCHNERTKTGGLALDVLGRAGVAEHAAVWETVVRKVRTGVMPPPGAPRPEDAVASQLASSMAGELDRAAVPEPGRPLLRRLNRSEYANVIRDLLDLQVDVRSLLPADDSAFGFDNNADLQAVSPSLLERYLAAADTVSALAVGDATTAPGSETYTTRGDQSQSQHLEGLPLGTVGGLAVRHTFPLDGEYQFQVALVRTNLEAIRGLERPHQLEMTVDGERIFVGQVGGDAEQGQTGTITDKSDATDARLRVRVPVKAGPRVVTATFVRKIGESPNRLRPFLRSNSGTYDSTGRPHVKTLTVAGPFNATGPGDTPSRRRIFVCRPASARDEEPCARRILGSLARRAYRRPASDGDLAPIVAFYREGRARGSFDTGIQLALRRLLASPAFVFRTEEEPSSIARGAAYRVSDVELASRLSFFLWSSIPDDTLLDLAAAGKLREPAVLEAQARRMLADRRARALVDNFAGQWLHVRNLENIAPNTDEFPDFDNDLRQAFRREIELFFESVVREDRSVLDLMTADYTFVDERLAKHYGVPNVYGSHFRRVTLADEPRRGLLGKGAILLATSHADRTAPVLRGKWILENLLGTPPPAPPANVPPLEPTAGKAPRTMRERMEIHRANPACAGCHKVMDSVGFTMENFNAVGAWRTREAGAPIDASGAAVDGTSVNGVDELRKALLKRPGAFVETLAEKLMIYGLGRGLEYYDMPVVRGVVRAAAPDDYRFSSLIVGIVRSTPFVMRRKA
jgi:mono/diheme cytochrome c family protein